MMALMRLQYNKIVKKIQMFCVSIDYASHLDVAQRGNTVFCETVVDKNELSLVTLARVDSLIATGCRALT